MKDETILKIARFFLTSWPEGWSKDELFNGCWNGHPDIVADERFQFQPLEDIPQWILEIANLVE